MARAGSQRVVDHGFKEIQKRWVNHDNTIAAAIGIFGEAASQGKKGVGPDGEEIFDPEVTNVLIAAVHEFGTADGHVPSRSWMRTYMDENADRLRGIARQLQAQWLEGKITHEQALGRLAAKMVGEMQARIARGLEPELADSTIARRRGPRKGHKGPRKITPLVDTGQFRASISWEIRRRGAS